MSTREQLEAEAAELYPDIAGSPENNFLTHNLRIAYVHAKTISAEQVEALARGWSDAEIEAYGVGPYPWSQRDEQEKLYIREFARAAFRAAGFYVEEGDA